ncbi:NtaA/DmoA family FMN-dependent monooxygenase [Plantibacter flavus]|uniref:NtaA/DmoA family FMN-dependent monooxygenase n=1 Tax=Plantibacter flavus TaxID=150123 RepID=UPI003F191AE0
MNCVSHITHGLWRLPDNHREQYTDIRYWTRLARTAEEGGFDAVFIADVVGAYDVFRGGPADALREGLQIPNNDPMLVVPAMAAVTEHLGFGITFSTSYEPPFAFARRMSTLDHLTNGRVAWNIVTSYLPNAARNFGLAEEIPHDERFAIAEEYLDVLYKLWEGSWDDDAVIRDRQAGVYSDPDKVRYIDHIGTYFQVAGPHLSEPSAQRTPVLFTATASPAGIAFAGRHAEAVFTGVRGAGGAGPLLERFRASAADNGRDGESLKIVVQAAVIVAATQEEAEAKAQQYREYASIVGRFVHASLPFDPTAHPAERTVAEALEVEGARADALPPQVTAGTVGDFIARVGSDLEQDFFAVGTPSRVADEIERWLDEVGIDGINLRQYHSFDTLTDFVELVVPELRRRGRLREAYRPGETLRERLTGGGPRLPDDHPAARYRGGRGLRGAPAEALTGTSA